jgi:hypothetical protein
VNQTWGNGSYTGTNPAFFVTLKHGLDLRKTYPLKGITERWNSPCSSLREWWRGRGLPVWGGWRLRMGWRPAVTVTVTAICAMVSGYLWSINTLWTIYTSLEDFCHVSKYINWFVHLRQSQHNNYNPFTKATSNFSKHRMTRKLSDSLRTMTIFRQLSYRPCSILQSLAGWHRVSATFANISGVSHRDFHHIGSLYTKFYTKYQYLTYSEVYK